MARVVTIGSVLALLAGCGVSVMYPPVFTGGDSAGIGVSGGQTGTSGTAGNTNTGTIAGVNTGINGTNGTPAGTSNGIGPSSNGGIGTSVGIVGGNTSNAAVGSSTGIGFTNGNGTTSRGDGTNGASTSGGSTTGGSGCTALYFPCDPSAGCGCGNSCVFDQVLDGDVCEETCNLTTCTSPETLCNGSTCALIPCGPGTDNGSYLGVCSADGNSADQDGTCIPQGDGGAACYLAGTSVGSCDPDATRSQPAKLCVVGDGCGPAADRPGSVCYVLCSPGFGNGGNALCQSDGFTFCFPVNPPLLGVCI